MCHDHADDLQGEYLRSWDIDFEELPHPRETTTSRIAETSQVSGDRLAKPVMLHSDSGYRLAVVPSSCDADLEQLARLFDEHRVELASEQQITEHFRDCDAGDHKPLVHMSAREFDCLMHDSPHGRFSRHY